MDWFRKLIGTITAIHRSTLKKKKNGEKNQPTDPPNFVHEKANKQSFLLGLIIICMF